MRCLAIGKSVVTAGVTDLGCKSRLDFPAPALGNCVCKKVLASGPGLGIILSESCEGLVLHRGV